MKSHATRHHCPNKELPDCIQQRERVRRNTLLLINNCELNNPVVTAICVKEENGQGHGHTAFDILLPMEAQHCLMHADSEGCRIRFQH